MSKKPKINYILCRESLKELKPSRAWEAIEETRKNYRLLTFGLELTRKCNLKCIYCYAVAGEPAENELTLRETFDTIKQAYDLGARKFGIIGGGETLLYPHVFEVIDYIKRLGASVSVFTNATLITPMIAKKIFDRKVNIIAKCNSLNPQVQDFLTGVKGSFDKIQQGIRNLREIGYPCQDCALVLESVICRPNFKELPELWRWIRNQGAIPFFERLTIQGRAYNRLQDLEVHPKELYRLFKKLLEIDQEEYGYTWPIQPPWTAKVCDRHFYNAFLTSDGYIQPCTGVDIHIGNIRCQKLSEILRNSPVIQALRHIDKNIKGYCKTCQSHKNNRCYGCRGTAYQITGDFLASDPYCWNNPKFKESGYMHLQTIYKILMDYFGLQSWWHADSKFEVCVGIILVQRTTWKNAYKSIQNLKRKNLMSVDKIASVNLENLESLLHPSGFYRQKARYLKNFSQYCMKEYEGKLELLSQKPTDELRKELLGIQGIGPESADSILLYAAEKPVFVIDSYTRRILVRLGVVSKYTKDSEIRNLIFREIKPNLKIYKELRAFFVELGKQFCRVQPHCDKCPLNHFCHKNR